ncbi:MAG TPA: hypothetical protein VMD08_01905 [Candidatus Baltobacteraceae bacterium]|nr:hypothetical protein [Candidatus Baltobacteraceae bacterium]
MLETHGVFVRAIPGDAQDGSEQALGESVTPHDICGQPGAVGRQDNPARLAVLEQTARAEIA